MSRLKFKIIFMARLPCLDSQNISTEEKTLNFTIIKRFIWPIIIINISIIKSTELRRGYNQNNAFNPDLFSDAHTLRNRFTLKLKDSQGNFLHFFIDVFVDFKGWVKTSKSNSLVNEWNFFENPSIQLQPLKSSKGRSKTFRDAPG